MKRLLLAAVLACAFCASADAKTAVLLRGIFGEIVAPLTEYEAPLKKKGYTVVYGSYMAPPNVKADVVIAHSAGADVGPVSYPKALNFPLDGTWAGRGCPKGTRCINYYAPINKYPFFLCCGGYPTRGSALTYKEKGTLSFFIWAPGHVSLPGRVRDRVMQQVP